MKRPPFHLWYLWVALAALLIGLKILLRYHG